MTVRAAAIKTQDINFFSSLSLSLSESLMANIGYWRKFTYFHDVTFSVFSNTVGGIDIIDLMLLGILKLQSYFGKYNNSASFQKLKNMKGWKKEKKKPKRRTHN
jgi:hypothetical protein